VPAPGRWDEVLNGDARDYGGSGMGNHGGRKTESVPSHGQPQSLRLTLPPLAMVAFRAPRSETGESRSQR
jgi:1,4-alpha-glucan branching enzyme